MNLKQNFSPSVWAVEIAALMMLEVGGWVVSGRGSLVSPDPTLGSRKRRRRGEKKRRRRSPAPSLPPRIQARLGAEGLEEASATGEFHAGGASRGTRAETQQSLQREPQRERGAATREPAAAAAAGRSTGGSAMAHRVARSSAPP